VTKITVHKLDARGREVWTYTGKALRRSPSSVTLEAIFDREDDDLAGLQLRRGDRFLETFYADRWYSVFSISDALDGRFKGWYCNLSRPARFEATEILAEDLALDLIVFPDGRQVVLDADEYEGLGLVPEERVQVDRAMEELRELAFRKSPPFNVTMGK